MVTNQAYEIKIFLKLPATPALVVVKRFALNNFLIQFKKIFQNLYRIVKGLRPLTSIREGVAGDFEKFFLCIFKRGLSSYNECI